MQIVLAENARERNHFRKYSFVRSHICEMFVVLRLDQVQWHVQQNQNSLRKQPHTVLKHKII